MTALRVGLNLVYLTEQAGGVGRYARELMPALLATGEDVRLTAFVSTALPVDVRSSPWAGEIDWVPLWADPRAPGVRSMLASTVAQWAALPVLAARRRLHVVHGLANVAPPVSPRVASVATIHDLIWMRDPETMGLRGRLGMDAAVRVSARTADRLIAGSHATRTDLIQTLGVPPGKIDVVHHGVHAASTELTPAPALRERLALGERPVVLCVAQFRSHKNLERLVEAHSRIAHAALVLVGPHTPQSEALEARAAELGTAGRVRVTGWISDADLEGAYRLATCFVLPSLQEGFGLPVLEAMARGVPVACSNATALPEVAGDAALLFDPHDTAAIAAALARLLDDAELRSEFADRGVTRAREFTWAAAARATLATYHRALAG